MILRNVEIALATVLLTLSLAHAGVTLRLDHIGYRANVPESWRESSPSSSFRLAQFAVPGPSGNADCIFFFFGSGQGGSVDANILRWQSQFRTADGASVQPTMERFAVDHMPVTLIELEGHYSRSIGTGSNDAAAPYQIMRVAIVETPQGNLMVQLYGAPDAVASQRAAFDAMVRSIMRGG